MGIRNFEFGTKTQFFSFHDLFKFNFKCCFSNRNFFIVLNKLKLSRIFLLKFFDFQKS